MQSLDFIAIELADWPGVRQPEWPDRGNPVNTDASRGAELIEADRLAIAVDITHVEKAVPPQGAVITRTRERRNDFRVQHKFLGSAKRDICSCVARAQASRVKPSHGAQATTIKVLEERVGLATNGFAKSQFSV